MCDEDATLELRVKTVRYFKGIQATMKQQGSLMTGDANAPLTHAVASARASRAAAVMSQLSTVALDGHTSHEDLHTIVRNAVAAPSGTTSTTPGSPTHAAQEGAGAPAKRARTAVAK